MGILETVKKGFSLMVSSLNVVAIFFVYGTLTSLVNAQFVARTQASTANPSTKLMVASIAFSFLSVIVGLYFQAGSLGYFRDKLKGGTATLGTLLASGKRYFLPLFLFGLIIMAVVGVAALGFVGSTRFLPRPAAVAVSVVLVIAALIFIFAWFLAPYSIVAGNKSVLAAMKESVELVKKNLGKILLIGLILIVIGFVVGFVFGLITGVAGALINRQGGGAVSPTVIAVMGSIVNAFLGVFMTATFMYFYLKVTHQENATAA